MRPVYVAVFGVVLSGCVATTLTPVENDVAPSLSLNQPGSTPNVKTTDTANLGSASVQTSAIAIPAQRPRSGNQAAKPDQLALAKNKTNSVAAQKIDDLAPTAKKPKTALVSSSAASANPKTAKAKTIKPAGKGFFASLFDQKAQPAVRKKRAPSRGKASSSRKSRKVAVFRQTGKNSLPGVRKLGLFGIYDSREGADEGYGTSILVASAGGLARLSPNGLRVQRAAVQVACLKRDLVRIIKTVQRHYGKVPVVTSGYRSPSYNRRVRGARNSMHIYCKAADIQVAGVSKWALAKYMRTIPGRGGVGTYCHTNSVHIDTGTKRDWNWRCRRGKKRSRRKRRG